MTYWFFAAGSGTYQELDPIDDVPDELRRMNGLFETKLLYTAAPELSERSADALRKELAGGPQRGFEVDDTVVVYYSGHGLRAGGRHYLACTDTVHAAPAATALATEDLVRLLAERGVRRLLLVLHTCHAGAGGAEAVRDVARTVLGEFGQRPEAYLKQQLVSFSVLCSSRAYETAVGQSFSHALEAAVNDEACGGVLAKKLLLETLVDHVNGRLKGTAQHATHATFLSEGSEYGFFPNPRYRKGVQEGAPLTQQRAGHDGTGFVGRTAALERLDAWLNSPAAPGGWLAITGAPGSGKSTLLRAFHRRVEERVTRAYGVGPTVTLLVDVRHRRLEYLSSRMAETRGSARAALAAGGRFVLLVDGLEEAGQPGDDEPRRIAEWMKALTAVPQIRVVATASKWPARQMGVGAEVDLDMEDPAEDMTAYAARLLVEPDGPGSGSGWSPEEARTAAPDIVRLARGNHLLLRLIALRTAMAPPADDAGHLDQHTEPPTVTRAFWDLLRTRCDDDQEFGTVCQLLTSLAFSRGAGLPRASGLWSRVTSRASDMPEPLTEEQVQRVLDIAAPLVAECVDPAGRSAYRLHHESYAEALRDRAPKGMAERMDRALREERDERAANHRYRPSDRYPEDLGGEPEPEPVTKRLARTAADLADTLIRDMYARFAVTFPSWWSKFPETVVITSPRGSEIELTTNAQGRETVVVRAPQGGGMDINKVSRWDSRESSGE
ncbi:AAA family ATPase [Streptomyces sp. NPDC051642]|uniref:AAA family ATPase n=1 Tax=Streptomyces sp. NPDC051642 TaxID=3154646 RepID=UPI00341CD1CF